MQYIINSENTIIATHDDSQNVIACYPGCRSVISEKPYDFGAAIPAAEIPVEAVRLDALEQTGAMTDLLLSGGVIRTNDPVCLDMLERLQPLIVEAELDINTILANCRV